MHSCTLCENFQGTVTEIYDPFARTSMWICQDCLDAQSDVGSAGPYEDLGQHLFGDDFRLFPSKEIVGKLFDLTDARRKA